MKVLLLKDVKQFGKRGEIKEISDGYARNYLIPRGLATPATAGTIKTHEIEVRAHALKSGKRAEERKAYLARLKDANITVARKASPSGALYEGVDADDVLAALHKSGFKELTRADIALEHALKQLGDHTVTVHVGEEGAVITVTISAA